MGIFFILLKRKFEITHITVMLILDQFTDNVATVTNSCLFILKFVFTEAHKRALDG